MENEPAKSASAVQQERLAAFRAAVPVVIGVLRDERLALHLAAGDAEGARTLRNLGARLERRLGKVMRAAWGRRDG